MNELTLQFQCVDCKTPLTVEHPYPGIVLVQVCPECGDKVEYDQGYQDGYLMGLEDGDD
jgi:hypothetical protein